MAVATTGRTKDNGAELAVRHARLLELRREAAWLSSAGSVLGWDQETYMPPSAGDGRAEQLGLLARLAHERATSREMGDSLAKAEADKDIASDDRLAADVREMRRDYDRATRVPSALVAEIASTTSKAQDVWKDARAKSDFASFEPALSRVLELMRQKAQCQGIPKGGELYDAMLDEHEPGATAAQIAAVFGPLRDKLSTLIARYVGKGTGPDTSVLQRVIPSADQHRLGHAVLDAMRFDLKAGRLDVTTHPFCSGIGPGDTRLTTRYRDERFTDALYGTMHEGGHGLYEQGLPKSQTDALGPLFGRPLAEATSLGIHESQSRLWENAVGRSEAFWTWLLPVANSLSSNALSGVTAAQMARATNTCKPSLIRVEADEATYNLHVMLRFELERAMMSGQLAVRDLPGAWNSGYKKMLGVDVPDDRRGCLQDVHWSFGLFGYFPTYTLGNLYAAQLWEAARTHLPKLDAQIARGELGELREWLRTTVHVHGRRYRAAELCERATGRPASAEPLLRHLASRLDPVYGV